MQQNNCVKVKINWQQTWQIRQERQRYVQYESPVIDSTSRTVVSFTKTLIRRHFMHNNSFYTASDFHERFVIVSKRNSNTSRRRNGGNVYEMFRGRLIPREVYLLLAFFFRDILKHNNTAYNLARS